MPRAKKWFLAEDDESSHENANRQLVLKNADGLLKKPYASQVLGRIKDVSICVVLFIAT